MERNFCEEKGNSVFSEDSDFFENEKGEKFFTTNEKEFVKKEEESSGGDNVRLEDTKSKFSEASRPSNKTYISHGQNQQQDESFRKQEALVNYCSKNFSKENIIDVLFEIKCEDIKIRRRIFIGNNVDLHIFSLVVFELFDFLGKSWEMKFPSYTLSGAPKEKEITFETKRKKKTYAKYLVTLAKLELVSGKCFELIYDNFGESWTIHCKVLAVIGVQEIVGKDYKTQKDTNFALVKLKSLFRPILIEGSHQSPPEGMGGPEDFKDYLRQRHEPYHSTTIRYREYYKELVEEVDQLFVDKRIDSFIRDFDFEQVQKELARFNFITFYSHKRTLDETSNSMDRGFVDKAIDAPLDKKDIITVGANTLSSSDEESPEEEDSECLRRTRRNY